MAQVVLKCRQNQTGGGSGGTDLPNGYQIDDNGNFYKNDTLHLFRDFGESLNSLAPDNLRVACHLIYDENSGETTRFVAYHQVHHRVFSDFYPVWKTAFLEKHGDKYSESTWNAADNMVNRLVAKSPASYGERFSYGWEVSSSVPEGTVTDWLKVSLHKVFDSDSVINVVTGAEPWDTLPQYVGHTVSTDDAEFNAFATGLCRGIDRTTNWGRVNSGKRIERTGN